MEFEDITKPARIVLSITREVSGDELADLIGHSFMDLAEQIETNQAEIVSEPFVSFKNLDTHGNIEQGPLQIEVGIPINREIPDTETIKCYQLPEYQALTTTFTGDDNDLKLVYELLVEAITNMNREYLHQSYEYYLTDETAAEGQQITVIEVPYR